VSNAIDIGLFSSANPRLSHQTTHYSSTFYTA